jgi:transcriptional regulator with XRE-family HTH domain
VISFGDRVREARQRIRAPSGGRLTQGELARAVGVERNTVSRWENSGVRPKDPLVVRRLAEALRVPMEWLFAEEAGDTGPVAAMADRGPVAVAGAGHAADLRAVAPTSTVREAVARRLPPRAYEAIDRHLECLEEAGATSVQIEEAGRLLVESAANRLRSGRPVERAIDAVLADIDAVWQYIAGVLRADGMDV